MRCIAADGPVAARRCLQRLLERVESLTAFPHSGRAVPEIAAVHHRACRAAERTTRHDRRSY
ncbi:MAG: type II toxin-antitoxin system RelE/ParE family toxin, partial [Actinobacteria bacterium]|nr:type II toxin-antitoxin system RelE/ParE family toxin [Actinomycetota bacterium]